MTLRRHAVPARRGLAAHADDGRRLRVSAGAVWTDRGRRPRGRPLHRSAPADRLHGRHRARGRRLPASTCAAPRPGTRETELLDPVNAIDKVHADRPRRRQRLRPRRRRRRHALARRARHRRDHRHADRRRAAVRRADRAGGDPVRPLGRRRPHPPRRRGRLRRLRSGDARFAGRGQRRRRRGRLGRQAVRHRPGDEGRHRHRVDRGRRHHGRRAGRRQRRSATSSIRAPGASSPARAPRTARSSSARCARCKRGELPARLEPSSAAGAATTLAVVATDAVLTKAEATKVAQMAHDGLARSINPVHTMGDGDVVFALATGASGRSAATDAGRRARRRRPRRRGAARGARREGDRRRGPAATCPAPPISARRAQERRRRRTCMNDLLTRRRLLLAAAAAGTASLAACATRPSPTDMPPIVFVPGNGDTAALWMTTIWRFESNGWPRERLHAIDMPYPLARDDDAKEQPGRTLDRRAHGLSRRRGEEGARRDRRAQGRAGRQLARRLSDPQLHRQRRRRRAWSRTPSSAASRTTASGRTRRSCRAASSTAPARSWSGSTRRRAPAATRSRPASPG